MCQSGREVWQETQCLLGLLKNVPPSPSSFLS